MASRTTRVRCALAIALLLPQAALGGCLDGGPPATTIDRSEEIDAGGFVEVNLRMNASAELAYRWSTTPGTELAFDVHSHPSREEVAYHERRNASQAEGTFTAPEAGTYSLLWENRSEGSVTVEMHLAGDVELVSVVP